MVIYQQFTKFANVYPTKVFCYMVFQNMKSCCVNVNVTGFVKGVFYAQL